MVYDPQFTPEQAEFFFVLTGSAPPLASRDKMLAVRDALLQAGQQVGVQLTPALSRVVSRVSGWSTRTIRRLSRAGGWHGLASLRSWS